MSRIAVALLVAALSAPSSLSRVLALEATTYRYDGLGRLKTSAISGGPNNMRATGTCFDAAGNRTEYNVTIGATAPCGTPPVTAPIPLNPGFLVSTGATRVIALSNLATVSGPAAITSLAPPAGGGSATLASGGQSVTYVAPSLPAPELCDPAYTNIYAVPYSVQNTPGGASASGVAQISVKSAAGPRPRPPQACP